jgi:hypothetical protein
MALGGYFLYGSEGELLLVIKSNDEDLLLTIIKKLQASRDKDIKKLGSELEENFHDRDIRNSSKARPQNKTKSASRSRGGNSKAKDAKHRSKPSA